MRNDAAGLASSLRLCGTGSQVPLWGRLSELSMPVLVLAGENDARFCSLAERIAGSTGDNAMVSVVPGQVTPATSRSLSRPLRSSSDSSSSEGVQRSNQDPYGEQRADAQLKPRSPCEHR